MYKRQFTFNAKRQHSCGARLLYYVVGDGHYMARRGAGANNHAISFAEDTDRAKQFLELAKKYTDFSELTTPMILSLIHISGFC